MTVHENFLNTAPASKNYAFIDGIRCIAMICIVVEHSFFLGNMYFPRNPHDFWIYSAFMQLSKAGTMLFFILAGFLIGDRFTQYTAKQYLNRRYANTIKPWLFWSLLFVFLIVLDNFIGSLRFHGTFMQDWPVLVPNTFKTVFLYTNYWFIINFLVCITVLLLFKKYLHSLWFGMLLLSITFLYSVNIYQLWFEPRHSTALFGFVFFLWLGVQFFHRWEKVERWILKTPFWILIFLTAITFVWGIIEIQQLRALKSIDEFNTLRISNICYSICVFLLLLKIRHYHHINRYLKPRETTFGIYLVHYILVYSFLPLLVKPSGFDYRQHSISVIIVYQILRFLTVYVLSFFLVRMIGKTKVKWLIGR